MPTHHGGHQHQTSDDGRQSLVVDCDSCTVRGPSACGDCVVTFLLGGPPDDLRADEQDALDVLADAGMVPPLRLVTALSPENIPNTGD